MRQPEDLLPPHAYLHGANLCHWNNTKSPVRLRTADTSSALARLQRIKSELLRDKGIELRKYPFGRITPLAPLKSKY